MYTYGRLGVIHEATAFSVRMLWLVWLNQELVTVLPSLTLRNLVGLCADFYEQGNNFAEDKTYISAGTL